MRMRSRIRSRTRIRKEKKNTRSSRTSKELAGTKEDIKRATWEEVGAKGEAGTV